MNYTALNIRHLRELKKIKQTHFAKEIGIGGTTLNNYEKGVSATPQDVLEKIVAQFGVTVELIKRDNLVDKFTTWEQVEQWKQAANEALVKEDNRLKLIRQAPILLEALKEHYIITISKLSGQPEIETAQEIDQIFQRLLQGLKVPKQ
jgi:transcriptional regulator with XRE-family HTH domain